jgi:sec-independent protein translocase protein TatC
VEGISLLCQNKDMSKKKTLLAPYINHFTDLQRRVVFLVKIFVIFFITGFLTTPAIIKVLITFIQRPNIVLMVTSPFQMVDLAMSIGFFIATVVIIPIAVHQGYKFLSPGLFPKEKRWFFLLVPIALGLFIIGFSYGFGILYYATLTLADVNTQIGIMNYWNIGMFVSQIVLTASLLGVVTEFPLVLTAMIKMNIFNASQLIEKRRYAYVGIFILVSLLPPTDGLSLLLMATPLVLLYEITIFINRSRS